MKSVLFFLLCVATAWAQQGQYSVLTLPAELKENANAVIRSEEITVNITSRNSVTIKTRRVVSVLNELGVDHIDARESRNVKSIGATVYNALGMEIKKIKRKDFKEVAVSEGSIITDRKLTYLDFTPTDYPFTIVYESEVSDADTGFLPRWSPLHDGLESVEQSSITVTCPETLGLKYKTRNFGTYSIAKTEQSGSITFTAKHIPALKNEQYSPDFDALAPQVLFGLEKFSYEGINGEATDWKTFGNWVQKSLIAGTTELPQDAREKIVALVGDEKDPIKKARIVYDFVQNKTRYVSIQLGVGGWKPMKVADVHRLGYGDCKALTNYTKALLEAVGVPSYYCLIYGGNAKEDIDPDFVSMQGNHATLAISDGNQLRWVECTSQTDPFDFQANFTDDRLALVLKPDGGEIVRTHVYKDQENSQISKARYAIGADGKLSGQIDIASRGLQYRLRADLERKSGTDRHTHYKEYFVVVNNLNIEKIDLVNDRQTPEFKEKVTLNAPGYATVSGGRLMFAINPFNQFYNVPQRYRTRLNAVEIERGFYDDDEFTVDIPDGFVVEAKPDDIEITDAFGTYKSQCIVTSPKQLTYKRSLLIKQGNYPATDYEKFRKFREQIAKADNAKCVLVKKT
ncbi:Transglutaminase-like putative cysteine protease [Flavobacterium longum]|uniref:DUF3857 domain-containing protein n=1 Tax=Flavobacterium longum TaxID=1299340 RepID=UPI0039E73C18